MKKLFFLVLFALAMTRVSAQEVIALGGYGYSEASSLDKGDYGFGEARIMFPLSEKIRLGVYGGYVGYGNKITNTSILTGTEYKGGVSLDSYGALSYSYSYYGWVNTGYKNVTDNYRELYFKSKTLTNEIFVSGGLSITDDWKGWFGHNQLMFDYQRPFGTPKVTATWKGNAVNSAPYNKESFRINLESGVKRFGKVLNVEPIIHLGYGREFGRDKSYYEFGGGVSLGVFKDWYREIFKVTVFQRECFDMVNAPANRLNIGLTFNVASAYQLLRSK